MLVKRIGKITLATLMILSLVSCAMMKKKPEAPVFLENVNAERYEARVLGYNGPALVLFQAENKDSRNMLRRYKSFYKKFNEHVKFFVYDGDLNASNPAKVQEGPTVIMYQSGIEIDRMKGIPPKGKERMTFNDEIELWILRNALELETDQYTADYECAFNNGYQLQLSNY